MISCPRWELVRDGLKCAGLSLLLVIGFQVSYLLAQAGKVLRTVEAEAQRTSLQAQNTLLYTHAVLSSTRQTAEIVRRSAEQQMGYYEAMGRRSSEALARTILLIQRLDERTERLARAAEDTAEMTQWGLAQYGLLALRADQTLVRLRDGVAQLVAQHISTMDALEQQLRAVKLDETNAAVIRLLEQTTESMATTNRLLEQQVRGRPGPIGWLLWRPAKPQDSD